MGSGRRDEGTEEQRAMREVGSGMEVVGGERKEAGEARRELVAEAAVEEGEKSGAGTTSAKQERGAPGRSAATGSNGRGGASRRKAAGRSNGRPGRTARGRLTSRDLELLRWLERVRLGQVKPCRAEQCPYGPPPRRGAHEPRHKARAAPRLPGRGIRATARDALRRRWLDRPGLGSAH